MAEEGDFKIAGAYVEIGARDHTEGDVEEIKARIQAEDPAKIRTEAEKPSIESLAAGREEIEKQPVAKIPAQVDKDKVTKSAEEAGKDGGSLMAPAIAGALIAGGPLVGAAMTGVGILGLTTLGVALQKDNTTVQAGWHKLQTDALNAAQGASLAMVTPINSALGQIDRLVRAESPVLSSMFLGAAADVQPLTDGVTRLTENALPGMNNMLSNSTGIMRGVETLLADTGSAIGDIGNATAHSSGQIEQDLNDVGQIVHTAAGAIGSLISAGSGLATGMLPALNGGLSTVSATLRALASLPAPVQTGLGDIATTAGLSKLAFDKLSASTDSLGKKMSGSALLGQFSGLAGLIPGVGTAVVGLSLVTGILSNQQEQAAAAAKAQAQSSNDLDQALSGVTHATQAQIDAAVTAHSANQSFFGDIGTTLPATLQAAGISQQQFTSAIEQGGTALGPIHNALDNYVIGLQHAYDSGQNVTDTQNRLGQAASTLSGHLDDLHTAFANSAGAADLLAVQQQNALGITDQSSPAIKQLGQDIATLGDKSTSASQEMSALQDAIHLLATGGTETADDAVASAAKAVDALKSSLKNAQGPLFDATGGLDLFSQKGQTARDAIKTVVDQAANYAAALKAQGDTTADISAKTQTFADEMAGPLAANLGISRDKALQLMQAYGLIPTQVATLITTPGNVIAFNNVKQIDDALHRLPPNTPVTVTGLTQQAEGALNLLGYHVTHMPNGTVIVTADTSPAQISLNNFIRTNSGRQIAMGINVNTLKNAAGGIVDKGYAAGGIAAMAPGGSLTPMQPIAQVVPPNTMRVVGDRLSGDEAFIPIQRNSPRSQAILAEVNERMGVTTTSQTINHNTFNVSTQDPSAVVALLVAEQQWQQILSAR